MGGEIGRGRPAAFAMPAQVQRYASKAGAQRQTGEVPGAGLLQEAVDEDDRGLIFAAPIHIVERQLIAIVDAR